MRLRGRRRVFTTALTGRRQVAENTLEVSFARPDGFVFDAGQYLQVRAPKLLHRDARGRSRVFSIVSSSHDEERVSIAYRETGSGFKRTLRELDLGSELQIEGPHGFYTLPREPVRPVALLAGGIGVTPFVSMLRSLDGREDGWPPITLLYANKNARSAVFLNELDEMARGNARLTLCTRFGLLDESFIRKKIDDLERTWYVAGPPMMVDAVRSALHVVGVDASRVHFEEFVGY
ncbi:MULTISPECIES: FAD-dependent oxidoreductase [unclassified Pseudactinotalea]|uniref:FAD-dependent oxidoreductase n=1 Tax=unclassified Pseudactinotalea TaxID=2649176 RepID=UPI003C7BA25A